MPDNKAYEHRTAALSACWHVSWIMQSSRWIALGEEPHMSAAASLSRCSCSTKLLWATAGCLQMHWHCDGCCTAARQSAEKSTRLRSGSSCTGACSPAASFNRAKRMLIGWMHLPCAKLQAQSDLPASRNVDWPKGSKPACCQKQYSHHLHAHRQESDSSSEPVYLCTSTALAPHWAAMLLMASDSASIPDLKLSPARSGILDIW